LLKAGMPQIKLDEVYALAQSKENCDATCQKARTAKELKRKWAAAQNNLVDAPEEVTLAEKNYYVFSEGQPAYDALRLDKNIAKAQIFKQETLLEHQKLVQDIQQEINEFKTSDKYFQRLQNLERLLAAENKKLKAALTPQEQKSRVDERKVFYTWENMPILNNFRTILLVIYYLLLPIYIYISDFLRRKRYLNKITWLYISVYLLFPFTLNWLVKKIFVWVTYLFYLFDNRSFKNIYVDL
jgi:hypothetical protein